MESHPPMATSTPLTDYVDDNDRITCRTMLWARIGTAFVAWLMVGAFLFFLWIITSLVIKTGHMTFQQALIALVWLAIVGTVAVLIFTGTCATSFTLSIDIPARRYEFACGIFPLRFKRGGDLQDFDQVGRYFIRQRNLYVPLGAGYESMLCLRWRNRRWPYGRALDSIPLTAIVDRDEAWRYSHELASRLDLPYAEVENKQLSQSANLSRRP